MKYLYLFLLFITSTTYAQQIHYTCIVADAQTKQHIPDATVSISSKNHYFPAGDDGRFDFSDIKISTDDTLTFSCIGYQTKKIEAENIRSGDSILLLPMNDTLQEVKIRSNRSQLITVGSKLRSASGWESLLPNFEVAVFMQGSGGKKGTIKTVGFYLGTGNNIAGKIFSSDRGDAKAPFRVKIYSVTDEQLPGEELTKDVIVTSAKKSNGWFDVDVSAYHIENPEKGFFVAFCLLDDGYYKTRSGHTFTSGAYILTPRIGLTPTKTTLSYIGTRPPTGIHWHKDPDKDYLVRATVETE